METSDAESDDENLGWMIAEYKKRKRNKDLSREEIQEIIGCRSPQSKKNKTEHKKPDTNNLNTLTTKNDTGDVNKHNKNTSKYMCTQKQEINKQFKHMFYINTNNDLLTRVEIAEIWEKVQPHSSDIILKTKYGFLLKSNTNKETLKLNLEQLKSTGKISKYSETTSNNQRPTTKILQTESYSAIIENLEPYITDQQISDHLINQQITHRYCKRIISRATGKPTSFIRIITSEMQAYEKIISQGMFFKNQHYRVIPSSPPKPTPQPCNKCLQFTHKTEDCNMPNKCNKCGENHATSKCKSTLPQKCNACGAEDHQAWQFKCPRRPTSPIQGIPNIPIKPLNKKTHELPQDLKKNSRVHQPITIHDQIINIYIQKLNKPKNVNREELIQKLKKRFIAEYNIDTCIVFPGGNRAFIFMFDLDDPNTASPTEAIQGVIANV